MPRHVLYVTNNEMGVVTDGTLVSLPSQRIAQYERVAQQLEERHEWKSSGQGAQFMNRRNPFAGASQKTGTITAVSPINEAEMLYTVIFPKESGGVYRKSYVQPNDVEGLFCADIGLFAHDMHVRERRIVLSVESIRDQRHIGLMSLDSPGIQYVTEGDTMDTAPYISPDGQWVYYASAGYARNEQNVMLQRGPMSLLRINLHTSALEELKGSGEMDYMRPKVAADGTLYYIQRPYTGYTRQASLKDALLAPVHFVVGFFRFFALFGKLFSNVPPGDSASGPVKAKNPTREETTLDGVRIEVDKVLKQNERQGDTHPGIVPHSWQLIRQSPDGACTCVKRGVLDYDLCPNGDIVCTNGQHILCLTPEGKETMLAKAPMVLRVAAIP